MVRDVELRALRAGRGDALHVSVLSGVNRGQYSSRAECDII